jgi:hypothetical protein
MVGGPFGHSQATKGLGRLRCVRQRGRFVECSRELVSEKRNAAQAEYGRLAALVWSPRPLKSPGRM